MTALFASSAFIAVLPASAQNLPNLGDTAREELSPVMERRLGEQIMRDIRRNRDYLEDAPVLEYLNNFGASLIAARPEVRGEADYDFFFFAVRDPMLNAFALPGGFIGVHSGLLLAAQSESELASVVAHEIGHVSQRHIARMIGNQKQDALIPLASMILGALAASSSPDLAAATIMGGQGVALQRQLNFSRDAEREADRVGLQILQEGGFDTSGMTAFFGRIQTASRAYNDSLPAYLRSHPMTTERIADIQARTRNQRYKQRADSLDFHVIRARMRVLQDSSAQGLREAALAFDSQLQQKSRPQSIAAKYGLAYIAFRQGAYDKATALVQEARALMPPNKSMPLASLGIDIRLNANQPGEALKEAELARSQFPMSRGIAHQYADALIAAGRHADAERYLRDQAQLYRQEPQLQERLAKVYAAQGKQSLQHLALAESYALRGSLPAALDQLSIARRAPDASFFDQSVIESREKEFQARMREEIKERQAGR
ncbi:M48 family metalloprotease [Oxalobacteraceae bacterium R-40]|uniref:M48 family metalloprotease n=1 Tax=Keguizhuia sedimenti TaxID=3064264 RepID=A0ABU1BM00_9BURK|nr:M48 family metalloprotease [Oxalobacteraceae bacterium R-40]